MEEPKDIITTLVQDTWCILFMNEYLSIDPLNHFLSYEKDFQNLEVEKFIGFASQDQHRIALFKEANFSNVPNVHFFPASSLPPWLPSYSFTLPCVLIRDPTGKLTYAGDSISNPELVLKIVQDLRRDTYSGFSSKPPNDDDRPSPPGGGNPGPSMASMNVSRRFLESVLFEKDYFENQNSKNKKKLKNKKIELAEANGKVARVTRLYNKTRVSLSQARKNNGNKKYIVKNSNSIGFGGDM